MGKPKHRRCRTCNAVTSRYSHQQRQGPFTVSVWVRDPQRGEVIPTWGGPSYCTEHAPAVEPQPLAPVPVPPPVTATDLLARAANDPTLDDDAFAVLSRALRGERDVLGATREL